MWFEAELLHQSVIEELLGLRRAVLELGALTVDSTRLRAGCALLSAAGHEAAIRCNADEQANKLAWLIETSARVAALRRDQLLAGARIGEYQPAHRGTIERTVGASDVDGAVTAGSSNGDVTGTRLGGEAQLTTDNGSVEGVDLTSDDVVGSSSNGDVELEMARAPRSVRAESDNGDVVVIVPRGSELYAVDATTDNGDAATPIRTDPSARRRIVARSDNGDVTVRYP